MTFLTLRGPDDAFIGHLIHDVRRPGTMRPEDLCLPLKRHIIFLFDVFDLLHEVRELRELSKSVVRDTARNGQVKLIDDVGDLDLFTFALATTAADRFTQLTHDRGDSFPTAVFDAFDSSLERSRGR